MKTAALASRSRVRGRSKRLRSLVVSAVVTLLVAFHAVLFFRRLSDASITHPLVVGRWAFAAALLIVGFLTRRMQWHRDSRLGAIIFWLLAALLHLSIPAEESYFGAHEDLAMLVKAGFAVTPSIVVLLMIVIAASKAAQRTSTWMGADSFALAQCQSVGCRSERAPPLL